MNNRLNSQNEKIKNQRNYTLFLSCTCFILGFFNDSSTYRLVSIYTGFFLILISIILTFWGYKRK